MFLKQTNSSLNQEHASMSDNAKAAGISPEAAPSAAQITSERRKSSGQQRFANLMAQKRDPDTADRRASIGEQKAQPGLLGKMWNDFTKN